MRLLLLTLLWLGTLTARAQAPVSERDAKRLARERALQARFQQRERERQARYAEKDRQRAEREQASNQKQRPPEGAAKPAVVAKPNVATGSPPASAPAPPVAPKPTPAERSETARSDAPARSGQPTQRSEAKRRGLFARDRTKPADVRSEPSPQPDAVVLQPRSESARQPKGTNAPVVAPQSRSEPDATDPDERSEAAGPAEPPATTSPPSQPNVVAQPGAARPSVVRPNAARPNVVRAGNVVARPDTVAYSRPRGEFLPTGHVFEPIRLDPLESQTYISVLPGYWTEGRRYGGSIVPFAFGFIKPFYRRTLAPDRADEWGVDVASFTQFEVFNEEGVQRRRLVNTDYKISFLWNRRRGNHFWRLRLYHISSHLGDDYLIRNQINFYTPNAVNYEQLDLLYSRYVGGLRLYGGAGIGLRHPRERERLSGQAGFYYRQASNRPVRLVGGLDAKVWQQTNFRPGAHAAVGVELGRPARYVTFLLEAYTGFRPYSQYESERTRWVGLGFYLDPF